MPLRITKEQHQEQKKRYNIRSRKFAYNVYGRWSKADIERVMKHEIPDRLLAKEIGRSVSAVSMIRGRYKVAWSDANAKPLITTAPAQLRRERSWIALVLSVAYAYWYRWFISITGGSK
jgi:hypothetical protein